jgi:hypothetical protein
MVFSMQVDLVKTVDGSRHRRIRSTGIQVPGHSGTYKVGGAVEGSWIGGRVVVVVVVRGVVVVDVVVVVVVVDVVVGGRGVV